MNLTAKVTPFSSVVGSSVTLHDESGKVVCQLALLNTGQHEDDPAEWKRRQTAFAEEVASRFTHPAPVAAQPAEGWATVPREPTEAMVEAGIDALREHTELLAIARDPLFVWRYMLSALPAQPNSSEGEPT